MKLLNRMRYAWNFPGGYKQILAIALPMFVFSASTAIMQFCDAKFLGNYSTISLAAAMPSGGFIMAIGGLLIFTLNYCGPMIAQSFGAKSFHRCVDVLWTGIKTSFLFAIILLVTLPFIGKFALPIFLNGETLDQALKYYYAHIPCEIFVCISAPFNSFFMARGKTLTVSIINSVGALFNILFDWLLIFGNCGFPELGIIGAGIATSCSLFISLVAIMTMTFIFTKQEEFPTRDFHRFDKFIFRNLIRFGLPAGFQIFSNMAKFSLVLLLVGTLGDVALAASNIPLTMNSLSFMPMMSIAEANTIITGQFIGKGKYLSAKNSTSRTYIITTFYTTCILILFILGSNQVLTLFEPDDINKAHNFALVKHYSHFILITVASWQIIDASRWSFSSILKAAGDTKALLYINLFASWIVCIPLFVFLTQFTKLEIHYIWMFFPIFCITEATLVIMRYRSGKWKKFKIV